MIDAILKILEIYAKSDRVKILIFILVAFFIGPILSDHYYSPIRLKQKIELLTNLSDLSKKADDIPELRGAIYSLIENINKIEINVKGFGIRCELPRSINEFFSCSNNHLWKFISGAALGISTLFFGFFIYEPNKNVKFITAIVVIVITLFLGALGVIIPTFKPFSINLFGYPVLQILAAKNIYEISEMNDKKKKTLINKQSEKK